MRRNARSRVRVASAILTLALTGALAAPAAAGDAAPRPERSLSVAAEAQVARLDGSAAAPTQAPPSSEPKPTKSFFSSPKGIAALLLMAGITAYTVHSRIADHVHSPVR